MRNRDSRLSRWLSLILWTLFCFGSMSVMLVFAAGKTIVIADMEREQSPYLPLAEGEEEIAAHPLLFEKDSHMTRRICIPLAGGKKAEQVMVENRYMSKELWIYIKDSPGDFYQENKVTGDMSGVLGGTYEVQGQDVILKIKLDEVCEYRNILEENGLYVEYLSPREIYDYIIVVDPGCGGEEYGIRAGGITEKDLTLEIAKSLKRKLDKTEIKVYYTRLEDIEVTAQERAELVNEVSADMYIGIRASSDEENGDKYGIQCFYNQLYFIPGFGNLELADVMERNVVTSVSGRAVGLSEGAQDDVLSLIKVPGVQLQAGYLTNATESYLLAQPEYLEKLTEGMAAAIEEAYEQMEQGEESNR